MAPAIEILALSAKCPEEPFGTFGPFGPFGTFGTFGPFGTFWTFGPFGPFGPELLMFRSIWFRFELYLSCIV